MFNNGKQAPAVPHKMQPAINMLSEGTVIQGTVTTKDDIRIAGTVNGDLHIEGKCILAKTGVINGKLEAREADIAGTVEGESVTADRLTIRQTGVVKSDIKTRILLIEEGARFEGNCSMSAAPAVASKPAKNTAGIFNVATARA
jgi:cytoskeletal protein CcmA (bactofilin family)